MSLTQIENHASAGRDLPLLRLGFRPFFLGAGISAVALILSWLYFLSHGGLRTPYGTIGWHAHEMIFGYTVAVIAGFLLTATKNWTGIQILAGPWLGMLVLLWLAGRVIPWTPLPVLVIAVIDLAFLPLLAVMLVRPILKTAQHQQLIFIGILLVLFVANLLFHVGHLFPAGRMAESGIRLGWMTIIFLISVMGGRVIPFFIERGTSQMGKIPQSKVIERGSAASLLAWMLASLVMPAASYVAYLACLAGLFQLLRWWHWQLKALWRVPMLWILSLGYGWLPLGLFLYAYSAFTGNGISPAIHAFTAGTIGLLTIGMMARVSLGHTGREIQASATMIVAFVLVTLGSMVRVFGPLGLPAMSASDYMLIIGIAGGLWSLGFLIFVIVFIPVWIRARVDLRPG